MEKTLNNELKALSVLCQRSPGYTPPWACVFAKKLISGAKQGEGRAGELNWRERARAKGNCFFAGDVPALEFCFSII